MTPYIPWPLPQVTLLAADLSSAPAVRKFLPRDLNPKIKEHLDASLGRGDAAPTPARAAAAPPAPTPRKAPAAKAPAKGPSGGGASAPPRNAGDPMEEELRQREKEFGKVRAGSGRLRSACV